jgi:hypothetical protein
MGIKVGKDTSMAAKEVKFAVDARDRMLRGIDTPPTRCA